MSSRRLTAIIIVGLLHALIGYAFITGLAYNVIKKAAQDLKTFDVEEAPPPPEEKPPPPPPETKIEPPPVVAPPPIVAPPQVSTPTIQSVPAPPPPAPIHVEAPPAPPPPPAPKLASKASARGNSQSWVTTDDYPSRALREEKTGVSVIAWDISTEGRVVNCRITQSSGTPELDEAACTNVTRRGRYTPAKDESGQPIVDHDTRRVRWVIPEN